MKKLILSLIKPVRYSDSLITFLVLFLMAIGLFFSTSASISYSSTIRSTIFSFIKQVIIIIISLVIYQLTSHYFDLKMCRRLILLVAVGEYILLFAAIIYCKIHGAINGNYSWISLGSFSIQPSEFAKPVCILIVACMFGDRKFKGIKNSLQVVWIPALLMIGMVAVVFLLQKDKGTALIIAMIACLAFLIPDHPLLKKWQIFVLAGAFFAIFAYMFLLSEAGQNWLINHGFQTVANRFAAVSNPSYYNDGTREIFYSLLGISKGNLLGVGLGNSVQKFGYLVSSAADYIFAIIVEETGIIGIILVFVPYFLLISSLLSYCHRVEKDSYRTILFGAVSYLFIHFLFNIGGVSGLLPLTGVPLLFLSKGGSATFSIMLTLGICQNIISNYVKEKKENL